MKKMSPVLPEDYFAAYFFKAKASDINTEGKEIWRGCLMDTETRMPLTVGMMFTKKVISFNTYSEVIEFVDLVGVFGTFLSSLGSTQNMRMGRKIRKIHSFMNNFVRLQASNFTKS